MRLTFHREPDSVQSFSGGFARHRRVSILAHLLLRPPCPPHTFHLGHRPRPPGGPPLPSRPPAAPPPPPPPPPVPLRRLPPPRRRRPSPQRASSGQSPTRSPKRRPSLVPSSAERGLAPEHRARITGSSTRSTPSTPSSSPQPIRSRPVGPFATSIARPTRCPCSGCISIRICSPPARFEMFRPR